MDNPQTAYLHHTISNYIFYYPCCTLNLNPVFTRRLIRARSSREPAARWFRRAAS